MTDRGEPTEHGIQPAELDWIDGGQPYSARFDDFYFSSVDGPAETRHVFLQPNRLAERFAALTAEPGQIARFTLGETGFGSGRNFLTTWQLWQQTAQAGAELHYISVEKHPFTRADLARTLALWPELAPLAEALLAVYPPLAGPGFHRLNLDSGRVRLTLIFDDASTGLDQLLPSAHPDFKDRGPKIDAWFLDGFTPARNPEIWSQSLFTTLAKLSHTGTTLATFTSAGSVRRGLEQTGFTTTKHSGFGLKREMLSARYQPPTMKPDEPASPYRWRGRPPLPWPLVDRPVAPATRRALVIGGGLAGCHSARALAERGWQVALLERHPRVASEASGNPQGLLYAKLSPKPSPAASFNTLSLIYAQNHYRPYWQKGTGFGAACGLLQLAQSPAAEAMQRQIARTLTSDELARAVTPEQASQLAGLPLPHSGLYFPRAGWLDPAAVCRALVDHPNIDVGPGTEVAQLTYERETWYALDGAGQTLAEAPIAVLANARSVTQFEPTGALPLKAIRGQITELPASAASERLQVALCAEGYLAPAHHGKHCVGATFNLKDSDPEPRASDHQTNLETLAQFGNDIVGLFREQRAETVSGRVAFRCATPDYLPLVGPVPDREAFLEDFASLRRDARLDIPLAGRYWPGLFVNVGHGSRGLAYTPLSAELLAAHITGEPSPVGRTLTEALHPGRFLIRDLMRNRV